VIWALLVFAILAAAPFVAERLKPAMTNEERANAPGDFARLPSGFTHYEWFGPKNGPVLVCIHGLTTPSYVWSELAPSLAKLGFRVLTYDLYGRGYSDMPEGAQDRRFFINQLRDLLDDQKVTMPVTLFGYSMGGSIATVFANALPDRVAGVVLLAPAGMVHRPGTVANIAQKTYAFGDWLFLALGGFTLMQGFRSQKDAPEIITRFGRFQRNEIARRGYLPAVLSSQRNLLAEQLEKDHRDLATMQMPVFAIWGGVDTAIPLVSRDVLAEWNPNALQAEVKGAGHALAFTHPEAVLAAFQTILR